MDKSLHDFCIARNKLELLSEWNNEKNGALTPADVSIGTHRKVWWKCAKGHEWHAEIKMRFKGKGCPICANRKVLVGENDLGTVYPEIAAQWHPTKNGSLTPHAVVPGTYRKAWWRCDQGHEWEASIASRALNGSGCPACAGQVALPGQNDLASQRPQIAAQWHPTKNGSLTPQDVTVFSNSYAWWICENGHEYRSLVTHRSKKNAGCPYCKNRKVLEGFNDLATVIPAIAAQWHSELNGNLTPQMVTIGSKKKVWWQCADGHVWKAVIYSRTGDRKCGCSVCVGRVKESKQRYYAEMAAETLQKNKATK